MVRLHTELSHFIEIRTLDFFNIVLDFGTRMIWDRKNSMWRVYETTEGPIDSDTVEWCTQSQSELVIEPANINFFRGLLPNHPTTETYNELPLNDFWSFLLSLMGIMTGVGDISSFVATEKKDLQEELSAIKQVLLWWIHTEGHTIQMKGFDHILYNVDRMGVNHLFRTKAYYTWKIIQDKFNGFSNTNECPQDHISPPDLIQVLYELIRASCYGDTDEMVVYCTEFIITRFMTDNHIRLATIDRLAGGDPKTLVLGKLDVFEAWRQLFPNFFSDSGKSLNVFFRSFTNYCIACYMEDTLELDISNIEFVPLTNPSLVRVDGLVAEDLLFLFGIDFFKNQTNVVKDRHRSV